MKKFMKLIFFIITFYSIYLFAGDATTSVLKDSATGMATGAATGYAISAAKSEVTNQTFKELSKKIGDFMESPPGVAIVSAVGTANSMIVKQAAEDESTEATKNIKKIEMLMTTFQDSWNGFCPDGRDDIKVPDCFCYLDHGGKNPNRSNSETCKKLWATNDFKLTATADNYLANGKFVDPVGCMTLDKQFDQGCKCKKFVDSKGNNACLKTTNLNIPTNSIGAAYIQESGVPQLLHAVNQLTQGNIGVSRLNGSQMAMSAVKLSALNDMHLVPIKDKPGIKQYYTDAEIKSVQEKLFPKKLINEISKSSPPSVLLANHSPPPGALSKALEVIKHKTGIETSGGGGLGKKAAAEQAAGNFNFNGDSAAAGGSNNVEYMDKNYKYKVNDITKDPGASIFEVISNRYLESGLRKLFDTEESEKEKK
jgi:hypothetical protein